MERSETTTQKTRYEESKQTNNILLCQTVCVLRHRRRRPTIDPLRIVSIYSPSTCFSRTAAAAAASNKHHHHHHPISMKLLSFFPLDRRYNRFGPKHSRPLQERPGLQGRKTMRPLSGQDGLWHQRRMSRGALVCRRVQASAVGFGIGRTRRQLWSRRGTCVEHGALFRPVLHWRLSPSGGICLYLHSHQALKEKSEAKRKQNINDEGKQTPK